MVKKIQHLPRLLTLKDYADSRGRMAADVKKADGLFSDLIAAAETGGLEGLTADEILERFGAPVLRREGESAGQAHEQWLYRRATDFQGEKVYLSFDTAGILRAVEHVKPEESAHGKETP